MIKKIGLTTVLLMIGLMAVALICIFLSANDHHPNISNSGAEVFQPAQTRSPNEHALETSHKNNPTIPSNPINTDNNSNDMNRAGSNTNPQTTVLPAHIQFHPNADYTYSSQILSDAIKGLEQLNELHKRHANISEADVLTVWKSIDAATEENTMSPIEGMKHKQWLAKLVESDTIKQMFETESLQLQNRLQAQAEVARKAQANDPKFLAYKAEEKRLTDEILAKYPNNNAKAADELGKALDKVRAEIYSQ